MNNIDVKLEGESAVAMLNALGKNCDSLCFGMVSPETPVIGGPALVLPVIVDGQEIGHRIEIRATGCWSLVVDMPLKMKEAA